MWGRFSTKEQDVGAVQKALGRFRTSTSDRREEVVYGSAGRLGVGVLLILVMISLSVWLLRRRTREEPALVTPEAEEEAVLLEDEEVVVVPPGAPSAEDVALREDPPPVGEESPRKRTSGESLPGFTFDAWLGPGDSEGGGWVR